jgi:LytS/YehU family sensor histidine kinase
MDAAADPTAPGINADEFQALEQKVLRAVELIKAEREARETEQKARLAAEAELAQLRAQFDSHATRNNVVEDELNMLRQERDAVRKRVEKMLQQLDELA